MAQETCDLDDLLERCENRISLLNNKLLEGTKNIKIVETTSANNKLILEEHIKQVKDSVCKIIDGCCEGHRRAIDTNASKDIQYIKNMQELLNNDLEKGHQLIASAKNSDDIISQSVDDINQWLSDVNRGPPEMPFVSLSLSTKINEVGLVAVEGKINDIIKLNMTGIVQIVECLERPGSIIISWDEQEVSDSESVTTDTSNITEYILQGCKDGEEVFHTLYEGEDMGYTMKFAEPNILYLFRVCKYHNSATHGGAYGPWSVTKQACTSLPPYRWCKKDCETESELTLYQISNKGRTATKVFPESSQILRSEGASYRLGETLTFLIEETGESSDNDAIGFISHEQQTNKHVTQFKHAAIMNTQGSIFVNTSEMVTKLPVVNRNSMIVFHASRQSSGKLRVSISVDDREVTFDWATVNNSNDTLYFACGFEHTGWQISVI